MELIDDDGREAGKQRILLESAGQHTFGHDEKRRSRTEAAFETDLPADLFADRPAALRRDPLRDGACRDTPRLKQNQRAAGNERRRDARRFTRTGLRGNNDSPRPAEVLDDLGNESVYREGLVARSSGLVTRGS